MLRKTNSMFTNLIQHPNEIIQYVNVKQSILYVLKAYRNGKTKYNQIMITELKLVVTSLGY